MPVEYLFTVETHLGFDMKTSPPRAIPGFCRVYNVECVLQDGTTVERRIGWNHNQYGEIHTVATPVVIDDMLESMFRMDKYPLEEDVITVEFQVPLEEEWEIFNWLNALPERGTVMPQTDVPAKVVSETNIGRFTLTHRYYEPGKFNYVEMFPTIPGTF